MLMLLNTLFSWQNHPSNLIRVERSLWSFFSNSMGHQQCFLERMQC